MPFDPINLRQPIVTVLPPTPQERGGDPRRIHVQIEIWIGVHRSDRVIASPPSR